MIPTFKDTIDKPTDFNDLHRLDGLDIVREQLEEGLRPSTSDTEADTDTDKDDGVHHIPDDGDTSFTPGADAAHLHTPPAIAQKPDILEEFTTAILACGVGH